MRLAFFSRLLCRHSHRLRPAGGESIGGVLLSSPLMLLFHTSVRAWSQLHTLAGLLYGPISRTLPTSQRLAFRLIHAPASLPEETEIETPITVYG
jgi:hypothetical protein